MSEETKTIQCSKHGEVKPMKYEHPHNGDELELCPKCYREGANSHQGLFDM